MVEKETREEYRIMTNGDIGLIFSALCLIVPIILLLIWRSR